AALPAVEPLLFQPTSPRLGPEMLFAPGQGAPQYDRAGAESARRESRERLRLGPPAAGPLAVVQLDLFRALEYGVQHSRTFQTRMEDLYLAALDVTLQRHLFEPRPFGTQTFTYSGGPSH